MVDSVTTIDSSKSEDFTAYCEMKRLPDGSMKVIRILYEISDKPFDAVAETLKYPVMW